MNRNILFLILVSSTLSLSSQSDYSRSALMADIGSPDKIRCADTDSDGDIDIMVSSLKADQIHLFINRGDGTFDGGIEIPGDFTNILDFQLSDMDNDGRIDLLTLESDGSIMRVIHNISQPKKELKYMLSPMESFVTMDYDLDGDLDILTSTTGGGGLSAMQNNGIGFSEVKLLTMDWPSGGEMQAADFNGDGYKELFVLNAKSNDIAFMRWNQKKRRADVEYLKHGIINPTHMALCDVDLDQDQDLVVSGKGQSQVLVFENIDNKKLSRLEYVLANSISDASILFSDINADGAMDLIASNDQMTLLHMNDGHGNFYESKSYGKKKMRAQLMDDVDSDGVMDAIGVLSTEQHVSYFRLTETNDPDVGTIVGSMTNPKEIAVADLDMDGDMEVISVSKKTGAINLFGLKAIDHGLNKIIHTGLENLSSMEVQDVDGDGDQDIIVSSLSSSSLILVLNDEKLISEKGASLQVIPTRSNGINALKVADMDGDGDKDIIISSLQRKRLDYLEYEDGAYSASKLLNSNADSPIQLAVCDIDQDGLSDIVYASYRQSSISWQKNLSSGNFGLPQLLMKREEGVFAFEMKDLDGDGKTDLISSSSNSNKIQIHINQGEGEFQFLSEIENGNGGWHSLKCSDLNNDGLLDLVATSYDEDKLVLFLGDGNGQFAFESLVSTEIEGPYCSLVTDYNGDGLVDIIGSSLLRSNVFLFSNTGQTGDLIQFDTEFIGH